METKKFAEGCMRSAFKAKVTEISDKEWKSAQNSVLKEYLDPGKFYKEKCDKPWTFEG